MTPRHRHRPAFFRNAACAGILALCMPALPGAVPEAGPDDAPAIVYASFATGNWEIWGMSPTGGSKRRLTESPWDERAPGLSPDGRLLAWQDNRGRIMVGPVGAGEALALDLPGGVHGQPCWTPDSRKVIFSSRPDPAREEADLYFAALELADGRAVGTGTVARLVRMPGVELNPHCSPDGARLVFSNFQTPGGEPALPRAPIVEELHILDIAGGKTTQLTRMGHNATEPAFSPDGRRVAFSSNAAGGFDLWVVDADAVGSQPRRVTDDPGYEGHPTWSPDGSRLVFVSDRTGQPEIWTCDLQGDDWQQMTHSPEGRASSEPAWRPSRVNPDRAD